jgi:predicted lipoprotein with Yx(FWY)xxD motif
MSEMNRVPDNSRTTGMDTAPTTNRASLERLTLRFVGAALLAATAAIHLDLYLTGYKTLPTIGPLFLLQIIAAFLLALAVAATGNRLVAALGAGFAIFTLGGYLLSLWVGLFGFKEVRTTAGIVAAIIEVAAFAVLAALALLPAPASEAPAGLGARLTALTERIPGGERGAGALIGAVSLIALIVVAFSVAGANGPSAASQAGPSVLKTTSIKGVTVITNAKGLTLYWFAPDSPTKSVCNGSCASYWPPVKGPATAGSGVSGTITTITRADGSKQAAYDGHPLYTYIGDSGPGQAHGNNVNLNGGLWHEVTASG